MRFQVTAQAVNGLPSRLQSPRERLGLLSDLFKHFGHAKGGRDLPSPHGSACARTQKPERLRRAASARLAPFHSGGPATRAYSYQLAGPTVYRATPGDLRPPREPRSGTRPPREAIRKPAKSAHSKRRVSGSM